MSVLGRSGRGLLNTAERPTAWIKAILERTGREIFHAAENAGYAAMLSYRVLGELRCVWKRRGAVVEQLYRSGIVSLPVVLLVALFSGMVLSLQSGIELRLYGVERKIGAIVAGAMCREMGPLMTSITLAGLVGSGIAAEIATMRVSDEIDALEVMSISPVRLLVMPRVIALALFAPALTIVSDLVGILGGALVGHYQVGVNYRIFFEEARQALMQLDIFGGLAKSFVYGILIGIVASSQGLRATHGAAGVGKATRSSVIVSFILIIVFNYFLSTLIGRFYAGGE